VTPQTALDLHFADGDYLFDLKLPQLAELQEKRKCGIFALYGRVLKGRYVLGDQTIALANEGEAHAEDLFETIRLGLIGGGRGMVDGKEVTVSAIQARTLVERYCHAAPLRESWAIAAAVLAARVEGYSPPGETDADKKKDGAEPEEVTATASTSDESSPTAPSSEPTGSASPSGNTRRSSGTGTARTTRKPRTSPDFGKLRRMMSLH
jgi:hypothetical protein